MSIGYIIYDRFVLFSSRFFKYLVNIEMLLVFKYNFMRSSTLYGFLLMFYVAQSVYMHVKIICLLIERFGVNEFVEKYNYSPLENL